jgi:hypothetical protein
MSTRFRAQEVYKLEKTQKFELKRNTDFTWNAKSLSWSGYGCGCGCAMNWSFSAFEQCKCVD